MVSYTYNKYLRFARCEWFIRVLDVCLIVKWVRFDGLFDANVNKKGTHVDVRKTEAQVSCW